MNLPCTTMYINGLYRGLSPACAEERALAELTHLAEHWDECDARGLDQDDVWTVVTAWELAYDAS